MHVVDNTILCMAVEDQNRSDIEYLDCEHINKQIHNENEEVESTCCSNTLINVRTL